MSVKSGKLLQITKLPDGKIGWKEDTPSELSATPCSATRPPAKRMQILEEGHWIDVDTRATTPAGFERIYKRLCRENGDRLGRGQPVVCGMRIITRHFECLGQLTSKKSPNEKADLPPTGARGPRSGTEGAIGG